MLTILPPRALIVGIHRFGAKKRSLEIDAQHAIPFLRSNLEKRLTRKRPIYGGVVDQNIDTTESLTCTFGHAGNRRLIGDVGREPDALLVLGAKRAGSALQA